jgi:hypothetical protein
MHQQIKQSPAREALAEAIEAARRRGADGADNARVIEAARQVIRDADPAAALMDGIADLQSELMRRRLSLRFLVIGELLADPKPVQAFLDKDGVRAAWDTVEAAAWERDMYDLEWVKTFDALLHDADTPLPSTDLGISHWQHFWTRSSSR